MISLSPKAGFDRSRRGVPRARRASPETRHPKQPRTPATPRARAIRELFFSSTARTYIVAASTGGILSCPCRKGTKRTAAKIGNHTAAKSERNVKDTKRASTATRDPGGSSRRAVKQELRPEKIEDPPPARSGSGPDTAKRRRTRTHADLEPLKDQGKGSAASATRRVKRVEKRVGVDKNDVKDGENSSNKRDNSNKRVGQHPKKRKGNGNGEAERENSARKAIVPPRVAEKAALIVEVMDALYPDPPIPLNHTVRVLMSRGSVVRAKPRDN